MCPSFSHIMISILSKLNIIFCVIFSLSCELFQFGNPKFLVVEKESNVYCTSKLFLGNYCYFLFYYTLQNKCFWGALESACLSVEMCFCPSVYIINLAHLFLQRYIYLEFYQQHYKELFTKMP